ncbi:hypothetical protein K443DRAFT_101819 [Laccaria amethystina LaAM-08-1]|uniref:Uncharacterized protein n=1 Tax=Laccaria amethystina LaAM-08-1 TaxID=1095629 RepID=A0A0C9XPT4_9AGAR|nr:hypothetical protein K443DRAFT_101819 [Laccaria amethystina LaAM-08-1]
MAETSSSWTACSQFIKLSTVGTLITHTPRWMTQGMGYGGLWVKGGRFKKGSQLIYNLKPMGFCPEGVWVMGYGVQFPTHRGGGPKNIWDFGGYGL